MTWRKHQTADDSELESATPASCMRPLDDQARERNGMAASPRSTYDVERAVNRFAILPVARFVLARS